MCLPVQNSVTVGNATYPKEINDKTKPLNGVVKKVHLLFIIICFCTW